MTAPKTTLATTPAPEMLALADQIEREGVTVHGVWHPYETLKLMIVAALRTAATRDDAGVRKALQQELQVSSPHDYRSWASVSAAMDRVLPCVHQSDVQTARAVAIEECAKIVEGQK